MEWNKLKFSYTKTCTIVYSHYKDGKWSQLASSTDDNIRINALSASLQYGIQAFEGLKAYRGADGKARLFRPQDNAKRLRRSADFLGIESPPVTMFIEACKRAVKENIDFLPPYESGATMYIRPFLLGVGPQIDLVSPQEVLFIIAVVPVSSFAGTIEKPAKVLLARDHDRAAPMGSGSYKIGGNYAASMVAGMKAKKKGYATLLYLDSAERKHIDEFSSSNFFAIKGNKYITPNSESVLPSITNNSLMVLAKESGMSVERRKITLEEINTFDEIGACGTAVVILPVSSVEDPQTNTTYKPYSSSKTGKKSLMLHKMLTGIQFGDIKDLHNWIVIV